MSDLPPYIISFDPGGTTGWASYVNGVITTGCFPDNTKVDHYIKTGCLVICERPFLTLKVNPIVFEVKGAIAERAYIKGCQVIYYPPSNKEFMKNRHDMFSYVKGTEHSKDALCHLIWYLSRGKKIPFEYCVKMIDKNVRR